MSLENFGSNFESQDEQPKLEEASKEDIQKVEASIKYSNKLNKVNNVLNVLDFPDNKEESFRKVLQKQEDITLKSLASKSKNEILSFLLKEKKNEFKNENKESKNKLKETVQIESDEKINQSKETKKIESKMLKIKSIFTTNILNKNPDIAEKLNSFDTLIEPQEKEAALKEILTILKQPWKLKSIIDNLGWADKNNPEYIEFRNNLIGVDSSFEKYFNSLENKSSWASLDTNKIIWEIEKDSWWFVNIDLNSDVPVSKLSLIWSSYSFDKKLDKEELSNVMKNNQEELREVKDSFSVLSDFWVCFDTLLSDIQLNWWKENFKDKLKDTVNNFSRDIFNNLDDVYNDMGIDSNNQIKESDISSFKDINSPNNLKFKIENIKEKFATIKSHLWETQTRILKDYKLEIKELVKRKSEEKEKQLEVLKFMKKTWFDLIPKSITSKIIAELQSNMLSIPWLNLSVKNIDLKNWHFWESSAFTDKNAWLNIASKTNLVKFVNKLITWNIDEPLSVKAIVNWTSIADTAMLKSKFMEAWVVGNLGWKYNKIVENLKK